MHLVQLLVFNYRSCKSICVQFVPNQPNVLIGINDCGKSTILKSIGLLLEERPSFKYTSDASNQKDLSNSTIEEDVFSNVLSGFDLPSFNYSGQEVVIIGKFSIEDGDFQDDVATSFSEHLRIAKDCARDNSLWLARSFSSQSSEVNTYLLCGVVEDEVERELWSQKEQKLKAYTTQLKISDSDIPNLNGEGKPTNYERIKAIYSLSKLNLAWTSYKFEKKDRSAFPEFRYLDWKCSLDDIKRQANDFLSTQIATAYDEIKSTIAQRTSELEGVINQELREKLLPDLSAVVSSLTQIEAKLSIPEIKSSVVDILVSKDTSDGLVHIESQGEGIKRQIWFGLLKAQAKRLAEGGGCKKYIWAFDEPETHLYPGAQRDFFELLREASGGGVQVLLSTHSTIFVDKTNLAHIKKVVLVNGYSELSSCEAPEDIHVCLRLKNSDFLFHDKFLVVEGQTEENLIPFLYKLQTGRTLLQDNIQLISLDGTGNWVTNQRLFKEIMTDFKKDMSSVVYIFDKDQKTEMDKDLPDARKFYLGVQDLEDSICSSVWTSVVNEILEEEGLAHLKVGRESIDAIKITINEASIKEADKFVKKLAKKVIELQDNKPTAFLPGKPELATRVCKYITSIDQICPQLKAAFEELSPMYYVMLDDVSNLVTELLVDTEVEVESEIA